MEHVRERVRVSQEYKLTTTAGGGGCFSPPHLLKK